MGPLDKSPNNRLAPEFLRTRHSGQFMVLNMSERSYDYEPYDNQVRDCTCVRLLAHARVTRHHACAGDGVQIPWSPCAAAWNDVQDVHLHGQLAGCGPCQRRRRTLYGAWVGMCVCVASVSD